MPPGTYRNITGNLALAYGLVAAAQRSGLPLFLGSYPITPASDILHELSKHKRFGVRTFQAEDEIAGIGAALGAAFGGSLGVTTTSGPGVALKSRDDRAGGLAGAAAGHRRRPARRPVDRAADQDRAGRPAAGACSAATARRRCRSSRRGPPSTASTRPSRRCGSPSTYRTPVFLLSDGYLANGSEPWRVPGRRRRCPIDPAFATEPNTTEDGTDGAPVSWPYLRDPETLARPWAVPGTAGLEHRIGGIEKADGTGNISYDPDNHDLHGPAAPGQGRRDRRVDPAARGRRPGPATPRGCSCSAGARPTARSARPAGGCARAGGKVAQAHLRHLNPFPANLGEVLRRYDRVLIPEMNLGQLGALLLIRGKFLVDAIGYNQVRGLPFKAAELADVDPGRDRQCLTPTGPGPAGPGPTVTTRP